LAAERRKEQVNCFMEVFIYLANVAQG
jgi:hypothetical protein